jgi:hypothetical protein
MRALDGVTALNLALVLTHQVDAAYWHEWEMFGLPGGIQLFNVINLGLFVFVLWAFASVVRRHSSGFRNSLVLAALSAAVLPIHAGFALAGHAEFHLPVSVALIVGTFVASILQAVLTFRARAEFHEMPAAAGGQP